MAISVINVQVVPGRLISRLAKCAGLLITYASPSPTTYSPVYSTIRALKPLADISLKHDTGGVENIAGD